MTYHHLNGPDGFYFRAVSRKSAEKHQRAFARALSVKPWLYSVVIKITSSKSPVNLSQV